MIQLGDLVELQFTVRAFPYGNGRYKMILQLRTIAVLDRAAEEACIVPVEYEDCY